MIAIIDDDVSFREALEGLVNSLGFATQAFDSGPGYLQSDARGLASCLIVDLNMPVMSGLDLQARLAAADQPTPVIFVTSSPEAPLRSLAVKSGACAFLGKPVDTEQLLGAIHLALKQRRRRARPMQT